MGFRSYLFTQISKTATQVFPSNPLNYAITNDLGPNLAITEVTLINGGSNAIISVSSVNAGHLVLVMDKIKDQADRANYGLTNSRVTLGLVNYPLIEVGPADFWDYNQQNVDLGTAWTEPAYAVDTSTWLRGASVFDAKSGGRNPATVPATIRTVLAGVDGVSDYYVYYFRKWVNAPTLGSGATVTLTTLVDDGAVYYLNGQMFHQRIPYGGNNFPLWGSYTFGAAVGDPVIEGPYTFPAASMVCGSNVVAVALRQQYPGSADITLGSWLYLDVPSVVLPAGGPTNAPPIEPPRLSIDWQPPYVTLSWTSAVPYNLESSISVNPMEVQWQAVPDQTNPYQVPATNGPTFFRLRR